MAKEGEQRGWRAWVRSVTDSGILDEAMPAEFYDVRREVTPKAPPTAMWSMSAVAYVPTFAVFIALMVHGSRDSTNQTKITAQDISKWRGGWTCSMISKVGSGPHPQGIVVDLRLSPSRQHRFRWYRGLKCRHCRHTAQLRTNHVRTAQANNQRYHPSRIQLTNS